MEHAEEHHAAPVGKTYVLARFETGEALGLGRSRVPRIALSGGLTGMFGGYLMMVYMNSWNWPINVGGRPPHAPPSFIPITFETTVLLASLSIFFGLLALMRFPQPYHPVFELESFRSAVNDGFWMSVALPPGSDGKDASALLSQLGANQVSTVTEDIR